jgi:FAD/FMN-containing dehydrogenase
MGLETLPRKVLDGFGGSVRGMALRARPDSAEQVADLFARATKQGVTVAMRGNGRSYGDAALNTGNLVLDMRGMNRILSWDPELGIVEAEPGLTIQRLWQRILPDGYWPAVTPGTSWPTLGGAVAMNIHGKNHYRVGGIGDWVDELDLVTPKGELMTISREQRPDLFHAVIGGFGMLGCITRVKLRVKRVTGGRLRVKEFAVPDLASTFEAFADCQQHDYYVGWVDCIGGRSRGRCQIHWADVPEDGVDPEGRQTLTTAAQQLPGSMLGVPATLVPMVLSVLYKKNSGVWLTNLVKWLASRVSSGKEYYQAHAAFHFLLDQMPGFRDAYQPDGFIQYQPFVPVEHAERVFGEILKRSRQSGVMSYLGVLKRHRPDDFLLSHALDGYSFALDYPVRSQRRDELWRQCHEFSDLVVEAGGRFYPAKDSVIRPQDFRRAFGEDKIAQFETLRNQVDPQRILRTDWAARVGLETA